MAATLVKAGTLVQKSSTSITPAFGQPTTAGNLLVGVVSINLNDALSTTAAGWVQAVQGSANPRIAMFYKENCAADETAPTFTCTLSGVMHAVLFEFAGAATSTVLDKTGTAGSATSPWTAVTSAPDSAATDLAIVAVRTDSGHASTGTWASTPAATWTTLDTDGATNRGHHSYSAYRVYTAGGSAADAVKVSFTGTLSGSAWEIVSFKAGSSSSLSTSGTATGSFTGSGAVTDRQSTAGSLAAAFTGSGSGKVEQAAAGSLAASFAGSGTASVGESAAGTASAGFSGSGGAVTIVRAAGTATASASASGASTVEQTAAGSLTARFGTQGVGRLPVAGFVIGNGNANYWDAYGLAALPSMKGLGATTVAIDPYYYQDSASATTVHGQIPRGLTTTVTLTGTTAVPFTTTPTPTGIAVGSSGLVANAQKVYVEGTDYTVTGNKVARITGGAITSGQSVRVYCDTFLKQLVTAAKTAGLGVVVKPMIRGTTTGAEKTVSVMPGATAVTIATTRGSTTISGSFSAAMVGKRILSSARVSGTTTYALAKSQLSTYGTVSPTSFFDGAHDTTDWCYIKSVAGTPATGVYPQAVVSIAAQVTASTTVHVITEAAAQDYLYDSLTAPSLTSWLGVITKLVAVCIAAGVTPQGIILSTEQTHLARWYETPWRAVCNYLHTKYPSIPLSFAAITFLTGHTNLTLFNDSHWQTACDYLGFDAYCTVGALAGGTSVATIEANWAPLVTHMTAISAKWGTKQFFFSEIGYRQLVGCGKEGVNQLKTNPFSGNVVMSGTGPHTFTTAGTVSNVVVKNTGGTTTYKSGTDYTVTGRTVSRLATGSIATGQTVKVSWDVHSTVTQGRCVQAFLNACWKQPWFGGFCYWVWELEGSTVTNAYAPGTTAQAAFKAVLANTLTAAGTARATFAGTGAATVEQTSAGTAVASFGASGAGIVTQVGTGTSSATFSASGSGTVEQTASGSASAIFSASGTGTVEQTASGSIVAAFSASGTAMQQGTAGGTAGARFIATGAALVVQWTAGTLTAVFSASGSSGVAGEAQGTLVASFGSQGAATVVQGVAGAVAGAFSVSGAALVVQGAVGTATFVGSATGAVTIPGMASGTVIGSFLAGGSATATQGAAGTVLVSFTGWGTGTVVTAHGVAAGAVTVTLSPHGALATLAAHGLETRLIAAQAALTLEVAGG